MMGQRSAQDKLFAADEVPMQKSALQEFEAKLVLHEMEEPILQESIAAAYCRIKHL